MTVENNDLIEIMRERVESYASRGNWADAESSANTMVGTIQERYQEDPTKIGDYARALEIQADLFRDQGKKEKAHDHYLQIVELLRGNKDYPRVCGRVGANLAVILEEKQELSDAVDYYIWALDNLNVATPPLPLEQAGVLNNLAFIYEQNQQFDAAEEHFLKALTINKTMLGADHESTADVWNNLGALYYHNSKYAQSLEMHKTALEIRRNALGENHEDTAQSHGNIALVHAAQDNIETAKAAFDTALTIMEKSKSPDLHNYAVVSANFVHVIKELGHPKDAAKIEKRVSKFMKKQ